METFVKEKYVRLFFVGPLRCMRNVRIEHGSPHLMHDASPALVQLPALLNEGGPFIRKGFGFQNRPLSDRPGGRRALFLYFSRAGEISRFPAAGFDRRCAKIETGYKERRRGGRRRSPQERGLSTHFRFEDHGRDRDGGAPSCIGRNWAIGRMLLRMGIEKGI